MVAGAFGATTSTSTSTGLSTGCRSWPHATVTEGPRRYGHRQYGRGHGEEHGTHLGSRGRGRRLEPRDEPADLGLEQPSPRGGGPGARHPGHRRSSEHREGG